MKKVTCYIPIPVDGGELPEVYKETKQSIDVFCYNEIKYPFIAWYDFKHKMWLTNDGEKILAPKFWLKKTEITISTKEDIEKIRGDAWEAGINKIPYPHYIQSLKNKQK